MENNNEFEIAVKLERVTESGVFFTVAMFSNVLNANSYARFLSEDNKNRRVVVELKDETDAGYGYQRVWLNGIRTNSIG